MNPYYQPLSYVTHGGIDKQFIPIRHIAIADVGRKGQPPEYKIRIHFGNLEPKHETLLFNMFQRKEPVDVDIAVPDVGYHFQALPVSIAFGTENPTKVPSVQWPIVGGIIREQL